MVMSAKEKKAFVARMKKGKKDAAKKRGGGKKKKTLIDEINAHKRKYGITPLLKKKKGLTYRQTENLEDRIENLEAIIKGAETSTFGQIPLSMDKEKVEREQLLKIVRDPENYTKADLKRMYKAGRIN